MHATEAVNSAKNLNHLHTFPFFMFFCVGYLPMLLLSILFNRRGWMINECGQLVELAKGSEEAFGENSPLRYFAHQYLT
jgi:hypothetical protein